MQITFNLPHVFAPASMQVENNYALRILLNCLINLNLAYLKFHKVLPLYQSGVRYGRTQIWETIPALYTRGYGDCKSLSAARIAELRRQGVEATPVFRWIHKPGQSAGTDYHILVRVPESMGGWEDPSKILGMGTNENARQTTKD